MSAHRLFAAGGPLARALPAYKPREAQMQMAQAVEESFAGGAYVFEAGTGTGKTFAYLAPLLANGVSALISTGARALQDQLIHRDLPLLQKALQRRAQVAVLKGRANYVCKLALQNPPPAELFDSAAEASAHWRRIIDFAATDDEGDIRDIANVPANSPALQGAVSTRESCPAQQCEHYEKCFLYAARARAKNADIVIVNHHLFLSDMRLKDEGVAEILPSRDLLLFDEAHLLPQLAPQFLGESASSALLLRLAQDGERVGEELCADSSPVFAACARLRKRAQTLAKLAQARGEARLSRAEAQGMPAWRRAIAACARALPPLAATLARRAKDGQAVEKLAARAAQAARLFELWQKDEPAPPARPDDDNDEATAGEVLESPAARWLECNDNGLATLHRVPISSDGAFAKVWQKTKTVVFASATLSVDGNFSDFCDALGLQGAQTRGWQSPYDFPNRALLFMPPNLPPPNDAAHPRQVAEVALPLVRANGGRAFVLFSSWRALRVAAEVLAPALAAGGFELLTQGDASNDELLAPLSRRPPRRVVGQPIVLAGGGC